MLLLKGLGFLSVSLLTAHVLHYYVLPRLLPAWACGLLALWLALVFAWDCQRLSQKLRECEECVQEEERKHYSEMLALVRLHHTEVTLLRKRKPKTFQPTVTTSHSLCHGKK